MASRLSISESPPVPPFLPCPIPLRADLVTSGLPVQASAFRALKRSPSFRDLFLSKTESPRRGPLPVVCAQPLTQVA